MNVFIVGPQSTGTSVTTAVVEALGFDLDKPSGPNYKNPLGNKEHREIGPIIYYKYGQELSDEDRAKLREIVLRMNNDHPRWALKVPALCFYLQDILPYAEDPRILWCERDEDDVVESLLDYDTTLNEPETARKLHRHFQRGMELHRSLFRDVPNMTVQFDDLICNTYETVSNIADFLNVEDQHRIMQASRLIIPSTSRHGTHQARAHARPRTS